MRSVLLEFLMIAFFLSGCFSSTQRESNVLQVGNGAEVQELDPHVVSGVTEHRVLSALFEGLTDCDAATLAPLPASADHWTASEDGLHYVFHIRDDAKWSNGAAVTAADFVYAWQRILSPRLASEYAYMLYCLKNARAYNEGILKDFDEVGVHAEGEDTLVVQLENPTPSFLSMQNHFAWYPVYRPAIEKFGAMDERGTAWTRAENLICNGPFLLAEWRPNEILSVRRNPHYWDAPNLRLTGIDFFPIDNLQTEDRAFRSRLIHITSSIPLHRVAWYQSHRPEVLNLLPYYGSYFYRLNVTRPPFDNALVRKAFSLAVNREEIVNNVLKGGELAATAYVPPGDPRYPVLDLLHFNPEEARRLLAEAGYPDGRGLPSVEILYNSSESHRTIAETVQRMWQEHLHVDARLLNQDWKSYLSAMNTLDYGVARSAWVGDVVDAVNFLECFQSDVGNNRTGWSSPAYDDLLARAYAEADEATRRDLLRQAEELLLEASPIIPLYFYSWKFLKAPELKGLQPNILGYLRWKDLYLDEDDED